MVNQWTVSEETDVKVDTRHLKMMSSQAIRSVQDAIVELITNSDDAYREIKDDKGKIIVTVMRRHGEKDSEIVVKDRAGGMNCGEMKEKILRYGGYSAKNESRGYMGRGAKDVVALGDATFESVKGGYVNCVQILTEAIIGLTKAVLYANNSK